jgi:poly [ADP-ribose] polymerase
VYADDTGPWDFMGNQTDVGNNNNKFYLLQLLESNNGKTFSTWTRWGRVGCVPAALLLWVLWVHVAAVY